MLSQLLTFDTSLIDDGYFKPLLALLLACLLILPLMERLKISPVLGYLLAGLAVGPSGLHLVEQSESLDSLGDLGVVFLLFIIGLNISGRHFSQMRRDVVRIGIPQVIVCGLIIAGVASLWDHAPSVAVLLGVCFSLSSTAVVSQYLLDREALLCDKGRLSMGILLAQDLAVVPALVMVNVTADASHGVSAGTVLAATAVKATVAVAVVLAFGRYVLRPVYRYLHTRSRTPEITIALSLLAIFATAAMTSVAGLSMELGAFMAGLMLAESEFQGRIQQDIRPFEGLLLGLFFITVGMQINLYDVVAGFGWLAGSVLGLLVIKFCVIVVLCRLSGVPLRVAVPTALLVGQSSEFVFVIVGDAIDNKMMPHAVGEFMLLVSALSMLATPLYLWLSEKTEKQLGEPA